MNKLDKDSQVVEAFKDAMAKDGTSMVDFHAANLIGESVSYDSFLIEINQPGCLVSGGIVEEAIIDYTILSALR